MKTDLDTAREEFKKRDSAFILIKGGEVIAESHEKGVKPFFFAVKTFKDQLNGASLADKIVGKAVALLSAYAGITSVYTPLVSRPAVQVLGDYCISFEADEVAPMILNVQKNDQCPVERMVLHCSTPQEAYQALGKHFEGG